MEDKTAEYAAIFDENIKAHGTDFEAGIAMEECAELIQAISKVKRYGFVGKYKDNLLEEIADVAIMMGQIIYLAGIDRKDIDEVIDYKLNRQLERIGKEV